MSASYATEVAPSGLRRPTSSRAGRCGAPGAPRDARPRQPAAGPGPRPASSLIAPDLAFLAAIGAPGPHRPGVLPVRAVPFYNATHHLSVPLTLVLLSLVTGWPVLLTVVALGWLTHVLLDRAAGYGLRASDGTRIAVGRR